MTLDIVSRQLGHSSITTTSNTYSYDDPEAAADAAVRMAGVLGREARSTRTIWWHRSVSIRRRQAIGPEREPGWRGMPLPHYDAGG